jgi:hypothetical protein
VPEASVTKISLKINGEEMPVVSPNAMTLGEWRALKRHFGVIGQPAFVAGLQNEDPDCICGMLYLGLARLHPQWEHERLMNTVDGLSGDDIEQGDAEAPVEDADESDPKGVDAADSR